MKQFIIILLLIISLAGFSQEDREKNTENNLPDTAAGTLPDGVYTLKEVDEAPSFPGGIPALRQFMANNTRYPEKAQSDTIGGRVIVSFVVSPDGEITNARIERSAHPLLDEEALRVVKSMPRWEPGKQDGKAVPVMYGVPFYFSFGDE
ncbi:MAG: energy transducer TonB [Bacteroidales bacterium]